MGKVEQKSLILKEQLFIKLVKKVRVNLYKKISRQFTEERVNSNLLPTVKMNNII